MPLQLTLHLELATPTQVTVQYDHDGDKLRVVAINNGDNFRVTNELKKHADLLGIGPVADDRQAGVNTEELWFRLTNYATLSAARRRALGACFEPVFSLLSIEYEDWAADGKPLVGNMRMYMRDSPVDGWVWKDRVTKVTDVMIT